MALSNQIAKTSNKYENTVVRNNKTLRFMGSLINYILNPKIFTGDKFDQNI